jgi:CDP-diacylglycerol--glycerol-3-phosphate 3-phosphatidyltransferase
LRAWNFVLPQFTSEENPQVSLFNIPNVVTAARFLLSIVVFVLIPLNYYLAALIIFSVAVMTDWVDGYWARRLGQVTKLGRILDPLVDKIIICGTFIVLAIEPDSGIAVWVAAVVLCRELLVTALRSFIEQRGGDFSANMAGKLKMVLQCAAIIASLIVLTYGRDESPTGMIWALRIFVWVAIISTVQSGLGYALAACKYLRK